MEYPQLRIEKFSLQKWLETLSDYRTSFQYRKENEFQVIPIENGFYNVLLSKTFDLPMLRKAIQRMQWYQNNRTGFHKFDNLIEKHVNLLWETYWVLDSRNPELLAYDKQGKVAYTRVWCIRTMQDISRKLFADEMQLPWVLQILHNCNQHALKVIYCNALAVFNDLILAETENYTERIQRLETVGADFAFYSKIITRKITRIFLEPFSAHSRSGWHDNYCVNMLSRLIFPMLDVISEKGWQQFEHVNLRSFRYMLLTFLENYSKNNTLVMSDTQLAAATKLYEPNWCALDRFHRALYNLGWSGKKVDSN